MRPQLVPIVALSAVLLLHFPGSLLADVGAASLHIEQDVKSEMARGDRFTKNSQRALIISVTNKSSEPLDLKVKHIVFGREVLRHGIVIVDQGEHPLSLQPLATEKFETPSAKGVAVETHFDTRTKTAVQGSGAVIMGYGVQVLQGTTVIAESYDPPSLKDEWGKAAPLPPPVKK